MKNTRTRIKVCGITNLQDAAMASNCGVDAIGLVFYAKSPRSVSSSQAQAILSALPAFVSSVGLFVNAPAAEVHQVLDVVPLDILQFHGDEDEDYCVKFTRPYIKVLKVKPEMDVANMIAQYPSAQSILLDAWHPQLSGGTGQTFDWGLLEGLSQVKPIILAGGLNASNVAQAIKRVAPYAVDVSSGVEESPGKKSVKKVKQFVTEVDRV